MPLRYLLLSPLAALAISLALIALVVYRPAPAVPAKTTERSASPETISDPSQLPALAEAPGKDAFLANCVNCHSARYVTTQPRFSRKVWKAEVTKMVDAYKAPISSAQQDQIVNYLVAGYGTEQ